LDLRKVKKLIELFEESQLIEMEISEGESTIRLNRGVPASSTMMQYAPPAAVAPQSAAQASALEPASEGEVETGIKITSPMVGTFYDASSPDTEPYVKVGSVVKAGDVLCIIEAMKTFNQFEAEESGTIRAVYKQTGDPVEFGEPLFLID
jgi:acetyl-CoA carboxylase biotin carboxyl carrier protein